MKTRCIIPTAGYGTRMSMKSTESKEMLIDPKTGQHLIEYSIDLCSKYNLDPLVITRKEKIDLIDYCNKSNIETLIIEPKGEWPNTILMSKEKWYENNIMILPDTRFNPTSVIEEIKSGLNIGNRSVIALHKVENTSKWCIVNNKYQLIEKPKKIGNGYAMGLMGFKKHEGIVIFTILDKRNRPYILKDAGFCYLTDFKDVTRTGVIE